MLDPIDAGILKLLEKNGKLSHKEIAKMLNRSSSAVGERIRRMENENIILNYAAIINYKKISNLFCLYILISVDNHSTGALSTFKKNIASFDEVLECLHITGDYDFLVKVVVEHMPAYYNFLNLKLGLLRNLGEVKSLPVIDETKREFNYPIVN